jgi:hypothetical protein
VWFFFQYLAAFQSLEYAGTNLGGTAYWDHVGGFVAGISTIRGMVFYLKWRQANRPAAQEEVATGPDVEHKPEPPDPFGNFLPEKTPAKTMTPSENRVLASDPFSAS